MKELTGTARNYTLAETKDGFVPQVEFILVVTEPHYRFSPDMVRERVPETIRFSMGQSSLDSLIEALNETVVEMQVLKNRAAAIPVEQVKANA